YSAAKAGVIGFTKAMGADVAASGINVNCIAPGPAETDFQVNAKSSPELKAKLTGMIPMGRYTVTQDIANMTAFLASDVANDIVGQTFGVDGGMNMV
ncbi:SDR family oxidoreductase, partial [Chloroflexota bacterium]